MARYVLVGDSYGVLDDVHSHWAKIWADKNKHSIDLLGLEGSNLVNISTLVEQLDLSIYDGLIYHFTSLLRSETLSIAGNTPSICIADQLGKISVDSKTEFFDHCLPVERKGYYYNSAGIMTPYALESFQNTNVNVTPFNMVPFWYTGVNEPVVNSHNVDYDKFMKSRANGLYNNTSVRWLVRANMFAYKSTIRYLDQLGIKHITVFPPCGGFKPVIKYLNHTFPDISLWDQTTVEELHPSETDSRNHITLELAQKLAENFHFT